MRKILKNKPLAEAIFELRWKLQNSGPNAEIDPHYKILVGQIYERIKNECNFHEQLPTASIPDEIASYVIQHRFRKEKDQWPLIQIGPGIITVNDTEGYVWEDFEKRINQIIQILFSSYPDAKNNLKVKRILLRYIDAVTFDYEKDNIFNFLKDKMKTNIEFDKNLFMDTGVKDKPLNFDFNASFECIKPNGVIRLRLARGKIKLLNALMWETQMQSTSEQVINNLSEIHNWVHDAHDLIINWFFKLIEGELLRRFE